MSAPRVMVGEDSDGLVVWVFSNGDWEEAEIATDLRDYSVTMHFGHDVPGEDPGYDIDAYDIEGYPVIEGYDNIEGYPV